MVQVSILEYMFSPFYVTARQRLGLSGSDVHAALDGGGTATINGKTVLLTWNDATGEHTRTGRTHFGHRGQADAWVNRFNRMTERARVSR